MVGDHKLGVAEQVKIDLEIEFENSEDVEIIMRSLEVEVLNAPSTRSSIKIHQVDKRILRLKIESKDTPSIRASLNSCLRWIILSYEILKLKKNEINV